MSTPTEIESPEEMYGLIHLALGSLIKDSKTKEEFFTSSLSMIHRDLDDEATKDCFLYVLEKFKSLSYGEIMRECDTIPAFIVKNYPETYEALVDLEIGLMTSVA